VNHESSKKYTSVHIYFYTERNQNFDNFSLYFTFLFYDALLTWDNFYKNFGHNFALHILCNSMCSANVYSLFNRNIYYTHWQPGLYETRLRRGKSASEKQKILKINFDENATGIIQTFERFSRLICGEISAKDSVPLGRPSPGRSPREKENVENVRKTLKEERCSIFRRLLAEEASCSEHASKVKGRNWICGGFQRSFCLGCSQKSRSSGLSCVCQELFDVEQRTKTSSRGRNKWGNRGLLLRHGNCSPVSGKACPSHVRRQRGKWRQTLWECPRSFLTVWEHYSLVICSSRPKA
jgi:hypothetical protein